MDLLSVANMHDFVIGDEVMPLVSNYRYTGCYINEFLDLNIMVADRV